MSDLESSEALRILQMGTFKIGVAVYRSAGMSDIEAFCRQLIQCPDEDITSLVFADFLQEHGLASLATALRATINLRRDKMVYAVSSGDYSDYRVNAIFSSTENAQKFIDSDTPSSDYNIEEYPLDIGISKLDQGLKAWYVNMKMDKSGNVLSSDAALTTPSSDEDEKGQLIVYGKVNPLAYIQPPDYQRFRITVWAETEQHAVKIANEKRVARMVEEQQGLHQGAK